MHYGFWVLTAPPLLGVDNCGRTVMVVVGRNIPVTLIDMDKVSHGGFFCKSGRWCREKVLQHRRDELWIWGGIASPET